MTEPTEAVSTMTPLASGLDTSPGAEASRPTITIRPGRGLFDLDLAALYHYRELLFFLTWRDVKVRYKQAVIGVAWVVLQPLLTMLIFTVIFGHLARMPSGGVPYPLFAYSALLPWSYFSQAIARSANSLVANSHLVSKIYFPRLIVPISGALGPLVDLGVGFVFLGVMMAWYDVAPTWRLLLVPLIVLWALVTALATCLFLSALNVRYRDVGHAVPFFVQLWMFASPVVYPTSLVPDRWRHLYALNPLVGVIDGFRWALLGTEAPDLGAMAISAGAVLVLLAAGLVFFKRVERTFADVI